MKYLALAILVLAASCARLNEYPNPYAVELVPCFTADGETYWAESCV